MIAHRLTTIKNCNKIIVMVRKQWLRPLSHLTFHEPECLLNRFAFATSLKPLLLRCTQDQGKKVEEGTHAELMKIDVVKGKPPKSADDTEAAAKADEQKVLVDAKADESGDATGGGEAGGQAKEAPAGEEVTLSGFYHLMWDTQMVR